MANLTRRSFTRASTHLSIATTLSLSCGAYLRGLQQSEAAQVEAGKETSVEDWMDEWMKIRRLADGTLYLSRFADPIYFLIKPIKWKPNPGQEAFQAVQVPVGFVTDFASVPRIFWSLLPPDGLYTYAAIVHDYLYWEQDRPKEVADQILKFGMEDFGVGTVTINAIYAAVSQFGGSAWEENKKLKAGGEKRTLIKFPTDPTTRWGDWKKKDVF